MCGILKRLKRSNLESIVTFDSVRNLLLFSTFQSQNRGYIRRNVKYLPIKQGYTDV